MRATRELAVYPATISEIGYLGLGLAGETGEVVDIIKKHLRATDEEKKEYDHVNKLHDELGDVLWYWVRLVDSLGLDPIIIMHANLEKLNERKERSTLKFR